MAFGLGLALWAVSGPTAPWALVLGYVVGVFALGVLRAQTWFARPWHALDWLVLAALIAAPGAALYRARADLVDEAGLHGILGVTADRVRLERMPAIAPALVSGDRRQTFFVHAKPQAKVRVRFGARAGELLARELGAGLYRVDYDPRRDGPLGPSDGPIDASIEVDGARAVRELLAATPLAHPRWFALAPSGRLAATVSEETDELILVSARGVERRVPVGDGPSDCAFVTDALVVVAHRDDPALLYIDATSGARAKSLELGRGQARLALSPDRTRLALAREGRAPELVLLDAGSGELRARLALTSVPDWIAFGPDADTLVYTSRHDASVHRVRCDPDGQLHEDARLALGRAAVTLGRARDGRTLWLAVTDYRPSGAPNLANHFVQDQILTLDVARFAITRAEATARRSPRQSKPGDVDRGLSPMAIVETSDGARLVSFAGSDELWRTREGVAEPAIIELGDAGLSAPHGVAELADGSVLVASPAAGAIGLFAPGAHKPVLLRLAPDDDYLLAHNRFALERRLGEHGFYEGTRSGISCQSCHMHADSDESAHNLGTHRLLPTLSVRGVLGTAPYLRDGSFASIEDLDHVAQTLYRGYLRRVPGRAHTLAAYVAALPRKQPESIASADEARLRRGARAFERAACPTCHSFPAFTNLGQQRELALFPKRAQGATDSVLDTPSLLSLATSAPYLSDGRARTLADVIERENRDDRHGDSARLDRKQRADLVAFLESL